jgi:hypothetical protein
MGLQLSAIDVTDQVVPFKEMKPGQVGVLVDATAERERIGSVVMRTESGRSLVYLTGPSGFQGHGVCEEYGFMVRVFPDGHKITFEVDSTEPY